MTVEAVEVCLNLEPRFVSLLLTRNTWQLQVHDRRKTVDATAKVLLGDAVVWDFEEEGRLVPVLAFDMTPLSPPAGQAE